MQDVDEGCIGGGAGTVSTEADTSSPTAWEEPNAVQIHVALDDIELVRTDSGFLVRSCSGARGEAGPALGSERRCRHVHSRGRGDFRWQFQFRGRGLG